MTAIVTQGVFAQIPALTMTSREIAERTEKNHADVMRDIRAMVDQLTKANLLSCAKSTTYTGKDGRQYPQYELDKDTCLNLLLGYDAVARMKVVKRWQELESQQTQPLDPANFSRMQLIELAMQAEQERIESEQKRMALEVKVEVMAPQVEALERIAMSDGSLCITDAAKTLQVAPRELAKLLHEWGWTYRRPMGKDWLAHQDRIRSNHMEHKVTTGEKSDGGEWSKTQARVTPKGLTRLAELLDKRKNSTTPTPLTPNVARKRGAA
jgi:phage antirepressor YoqD-like protein